MNVAQYSLYDQAVLFLAALVLFVSILMLVQKRLYALVALFSVQGAMLAAAAAIAAYSLPYPHLYWSAAITLSIKALLIPWMLRRLIRQMAMQHETEAPLYSAHALGAAAAALVLFSYSVVLPIEKLSTLATRNTIAISLAVVLLGMLLMIVRRQAVAHVVGFMAIENGLFFAAVSATRGMPMVVELGVAFDVLVAAVIFGVFFFHIRSSIESLDVDRLSRLSEVDQ